MYCMWSGGFLVAILLFGIRCKDILITMSHLFLKANEPTFPTPCMDVWDLSTGTPNSPLYLHLDALFNLIFHCH